MAISDISSLYIQELRHLYDAERQLVDALPRVAQAANSPKLIEAVQHNYNQCRENVSRLEQIFTETGTSASGPECKGVQCLIQETEGLINSVPKGSTRDAGLILGTQKLEHYKIAGYGGAKEFAKILDQDKHADLLGSCLDESSKANSKLTDIATGEVNEAALSESGTHQPAVNR